MRGDDLTHEQLEALQARLGPTLTYLSKLVNRITLGQWVADSPQPIAQGLARMLRP